MLLNCHCGGRVGGDFTSQKSLKPGSVCGREGQTEEEHCEFALDAGAYPRLLLVETTGGFCRGTGRRVAEISLVELFGE